MERLPQIARKDYRDAIRERQLYLLGGLFLLIGGVLGYIVGQAGVTQGWELPRFGLTAIVFFGSLSIVVLSYHGIVGKRDSGELRVLLSLPFSRPEVVFGTYLGRLLVVGSLVAASLLVATVVALGMGSTVSLGLLVGSFLVGAVVLVIYASIGIGISAGSQDTSRAAGLAFGAFFVFTFRLWELAPTIVRLALNGFSGLGRETPEWAIAWGQLSPLAGLHNVLREVAPQLANAFTGFVPMPTGEAVYLEPFFGALVVLFWAIVPLLTGFWQFRNADL